MQPLEQALLHLPHVGPKRAARLMAEGCGTWSAIAAAPHAAGLSAAQWAEAQAEARRCLAAVAADDPRPLARALHPREQWRVLAHWFGQATFFDIETSGLEPQSEVTLAVCLHRGELRLFLQGENLDELLPLLDDVKLLVTFNGTGFDVPRIEDRFHIPRIPCAHVDLRWMCHHHGWHGGLKAIEQQRGLQRPPDLRGMGGAQAVWLWQMWREQRHADARRTLERYCAADVVVLLRLAAELLAAHGCAVVVPAADELWETVHARLPAPERAVPLPAPAPPPGGDGARPPADAIAAAAAPALSREEKQRRLRELWRQMRDATPGGGS